MNKEKLLSIFILTISVGVLIALNWSKIPKFNSRKEISVPYARYYTEEWDISSVLEERLLMVGVDSEVTITITRFDGGYVVDNIMVFAEDIPSIDTAKNIIRQSVAYEGDVSFYVRRKKE